MLLHRLSNGKTVLIRGIQPGDKAELQAGLTRLSAETIRRRFLAAKPRFSKGELTYLTELDGTRHFAIVAVDVRTHHIVGVARAVRLPDDPETAEWAIVVADPLQGLGLGRRMAELLAERAKLAGIRRFSATMLGDNVAVHRLMATIADRFERDEVHDGLREVVVDLAA